MLWVWKWVNRERLKYETNEDSISIKFPGDIGEKFMGGFLETSGEDISNTIRTYRYYYVNQYGNTIADDLDINIGGRYNDPPPFSCPKEESKTKPSEQQKKLQEELKAKKQDYYTIYGNGGEYSSDTTVSVEVEFERVATNIIKTESPIKNFDKEDACWIKSEPTQYYLRFGALLTYIKTDIIPKIDTENPDRYKVEADSPIKDFHKEDACFIKSEPTQYYLRFGALLQYLKSNVIPRINTEDPDHYNKPPMFNVSYQPYKNFMYVLPNSISLDPRVCIVRNDAFRKTSGDVEVFKNLQPFRAVDYGNPNPNKAYIMNIYLNFNFIIESLNSNTDERGDISVFEFLKAICDGLNKSLGGINNLEPIINEENNTLEIIETTPIPGVNNTDTPPYTLQLYGYEKTSNGYISNFVRKVDLKTAITPEYATMITVGATAGGYVKGTEATAFSRWNKGLTDRFKEKFLPANESSLEEGGENEALTNYVQQFLSPSKIITCYGFSGILTNDTSTPVSNLKLSEDAISSNLSVVTEYYKWLISSQKNQQGGTIGFIPFKLSFTMNGLSGIKIYNKLHVDTRFLPKAYGSSVDLIVTGVSHKLQNNDWETDIEATLMPKTNNLEDVIISSNIINEGIQDEVNIQKAALQKPAKSPPNDVIQAMKDYGITTPLQRAHFLAQISHESAQFVYREEIASGAAYEGRKDLGNTVKGDGVRFKGRGYMQLTGRANYISYNIYLKSKGITDDVVKNPSLVATKYAADVSAWYWAILGPKGPKKFNQKADTGSSEAVVSKISTWVNGGNPANGLADRKQKFNYYWAALQKSPNAYT